MRYETILVEDNNHIRCITLNRPLKLNAINYDLIEELSNTIDNCQNNDDIRVVVLKGAGKCFCAGDDLKGMGTQKNPSLDAHVINRVNMGYPKLLSKIRNLRKPVLAVVHGYALGAGCDLALACDMIFATEDSKFGLVFSERGLVGGTALLPKLVGYQKACEILFGGEMFTAVEGKEMGIVNYTSLTYADLESISNKWASKYSKSATTALGLMKQALNQSIGETFEKSLEIQKHITVGVYHTQDSVEGKQAFIEKRDSNFKGK